ncbi:PIN domain-containing protein [Pseudofrankia sp. DC12]|uniref:PIN domain-containing protein n=1 Tax=Pseudofrankia sp. DC12 TaxID=683315 RepID=UPI000695BA70|nr:PIN domain-containing protein [Pseudofrankia sp. DC12]
MFSALLDTCVLVPSRTRDVLLEIASTGAYRPLWSTEILTELDRTLRTLLGKRGTSPEEIGAYLTRLFRQMTTTFPDALVTDWEPLVPTVDLPDPDDRHVVAAAWAGRADVIVTNNLADFPASGLGRRRRDGRPAAVADRDPVPGVIRGHGHQAGVPPRPADRWFRARGRPGQVPRR